MHESGCCLGFDFGLRKTGVAVGQFITLSATPLPHLKHNNGEIPWQRIQDLLKEWHPKCLIVGYPKDLEGRDLSITPAVLAFAKKLEGFNLPVYLSDERLTTKEARQNLFEQGGFKALAYGKIDSIAAAIILEQWMNEQLRTRS
jgi:putative Holliday junction resolvase